MSTFQIVESSLSPFAVWKPSLCSRFCFFTSEIRCFDRFRSNRFRSGISNRKRLLRISCKLREGENPSNGNGEEAPESLFMKELRRRGMTPTSLLEETKSEEDGVSSLPSVSENRVLNQREQSMALNSEGLEGLIPRAKLLLTLGGTFFLGFGPLILLTVATFSALYLYLGQNFVHDGSSSRTTPPPYIDPYQLLEEERITPPAPPLN